MKLVRTLFLLALPMFLAVSLTSEAVITIDLVEEGGNLVRGTLSGSANTSGLTYEGAVTVTGANPPLLSANIGTVWFGDPIEKELDVSSACRGPASDFPAGGRRGGNV